MAQLGINIRTLVWTTAAVTAVMAAPAVASAQQSSGGYTAKAGQPAMKNIVQVASEAGTFETLVTAVKAAGLAETLQGEGPFTVFAPSDEAFAKLPAGTLDALLKDPEALASVLTFHVVPGRVVAADIVRMNGARPATVNGEALDVRVRDGKVYVNGAQVTSADVSASNAVIHVIDTVLLPTPPAGR